MKSMKTKLILVFTAIILVLAGTLGYISVSLMTRKLMDGAHDDLIQIAKEEAKYIHARTLVEKRYVDSLAQLPMLSDDKVSLEEKIRFYENEAKRTGYLAFAFADKNGDSTVFNSQRETTNIASRAYFQEALNGEPAVSDVLISSVTGTPVVLYAAPVYKNGQIIGVLYGRKDGQTMSDIVSEVSYKKTGFAYAVNTEGTAVGDKNRDLVTSQTNYLKSAETDPGMKEMAKFMEDKMLTQTVGSGEYRYEGKDYITAFSPVKDTSWIMAVSVEAEEISEEVQGMRNLLIGACVIAVLAGTVIIYIVSHRMTKPIKAVTSAAKEIADGSFDVQLSVASKDEVGQLSQAFNLTIDRLVDYQGYIDEISDALNLISNGNLLVDLKKDYVGQFKKLKDNMTALVQSLNSTLLQISQAADQVSDGSDQVANSAQALSQGATQQASSVEELSASIAEIAGQIKQNADNAELVSQKAASAGRELKNSDEQMREMIRAMERITLKSSEISKIIKAIDDIAFQTNILALNAAVEAARAGESGKGFAVVADEVRNLAGKSAEAAKNTTVLIEETLAAVGKGSDIAGKTAKALSESAGTTSEVVFLIDKIAKATGDQAIAIEQVNQGVDQISAVVQNNAATAEESAAASEELSGQSNLLKELISNFKLKEETLSGSGPVLSSPEPYEMPLKSPVREEWGDKY